MPSWGWRCFDGLSLGAQGWCDSGWWSLPPLSCRKCCIPWAPEVTSPYTRDWPLSLCSGGCEEENVRNFEPGISYEDPGRGNCHPNDIQWIFGLSLGNSMQKASCWNVLSSVSSSLKPREKRYTLALHQEGDGAGRGMGVLQHSHTKWSHARSLLCEPGHKGWELVQQHDSPALQAACLCELVCSHQQPAPYSNRRPREVTQKSPIHLSNKDLWMSVNWKSVDQEEPMLDFLLQIFSLQPKTWGWKCVLMLNTMI